MVAFGISSYKPGAVSANTKVGIINLDYVVAKSQAGIELGNKLEAFQERIQAEGEVMAQAARDIRQRVADGATSLSEEKLAELHKQYEDKQIEIRRFQDDKQREGQKMQNEGLKEIEKQLEPVVKMLVEQMGIEILLNNTPGIVVWSGETVDYTDQLIELLNN